MLPSLIPALTSDAFKFLEHYKLSAFTDPLLKYDWVEDLYSYLDFLQMLSTQLQSTA
jgi:hypothetical protein